MLLRNVVLRRNTWLVYKRCKTTQTNPKWKSVVGIEIHSQIDTKSKLFSGAAVDFAAPVNTCVSLFDAGIPGTLPVLNKRCVELAVMTALVLKCRLNEVSMFDRKHYFYADLPMGYQITQQRSPIASDGVIEFQVFNPMVHKEPYRKSSKIKQLQLEQDSGRSLHDNLANKSLVDLNRAGTPLMEFVFDPDLEDGEEAAALVKEVILILTRIGACNGLLQEGALRVDANVSVHQSGEPLGVRTEIKNIGSVRAVAAAIKHEIERQIEIKESGGIVINQTRAWDNKTKTTIAMRDKEVVQDYRYMPEPNLPPLRLSMTGESSTLVNVPKLKEQIPELPDVIRKRIIENFGLKPENASKIVNDYVLLKYFADILAKNPNRDPVIIGNLLIIDFLHYLDNYSIDLEECTFPSESLGELVDLLQNNTINIMLARNVLDIMFSSNKFQPYVIIKENDWFLINDDEIITKFCIKAINENQHLVKKYRKGKMKYFHSLVGKVALETNNKANMPKVVAKMESLLKE